MLKLAINLVFIKNFSSCCYGVEEWKKSAGTVTPREIEMMRMMLQHGMLDEDDEQRCKDMIAEHERKQEKFNMSPCDKTKADREKWSTFLELYEIRLRVEQSLDGRLELLKRTNPKEKG